MNERLIKMINDEAYKAYKHDEVPVGCVIIKNNKIISKAHNKRQKTHLCINHAEIIAINKAEKRLKDWRLDDCELYVTLKPCPMCVEVIKQCRIKKVHYLIDSKFNSEPKNAIEFLKINDKSEEKYKEMLSKFFSCKR